MPRLRRHEKRSHPDRPSNGWPRVAAMAVVGVAGTITAVLTESGELTIGVITSMLQFFPR